MLCYSRSCCRSPPLATAGCTTEVRQELHEEHLTWTRLSEETCCRDGKWRSLCKVSFSGWILRASEVGSWHISSWLRDRRFEWEDNVGKRSWRLKDTGWSWVRQHQKVFLSLLHVLVIDLPFTCNPLLLGQSLISGTKFWKHVLLSLS